MEEQEQKQVICNARITKTAWSRETSNGDLAYIIALEGQNWGSRFHGFPLKGDALEKWINTLMNVFETSELNENILSGKIVRVAIQGNSVVAIGHPYKSIWLNPDEILKQPEQEKDEEKKEDEQQHN